MHFAIKKRKKLQLSFSSFCCMVKFSFQIPAFHSIELEAINHNGMEFAYLIYLKLLFFLYSNSLSCSSLPVDLLATEKLTDRPTIRPTIRKNEQKNTRNALRISIYIYQNEFHRINQIGSMNERISPD